MYAVSNEPEKTYCAEFPAPLQRLETATEEHVEVILVQVPMNVMLGSVALIVTFVPEDGAFETVGTDEERVALDGKVVDGRVDEDVDVDLDVYV